MSVQRRVEYGLSRLTSAFPEPKIVYEQYPTSPEIASHMFAMMDEEGDVEGRHILDLGSGTGMLSLGALLAGAASVRGIEIDPDAMAVAEENLALLVEAGEVDEEEAERVVWQEGDVLEVGEGEGEEDGGGEGGAARIEADTVVLNPPFGTKKVKGLDTKFLTVAFACAKRAVYSLHKTSTRRFLLKFAKKMGVEAEVLAQLRYDLPKSYRFHKKKSVDIEVDFIRFRIPERRAVEGEAEGEAEAEQQE